MRLDQTELIAIYPVLEQRGPEGERGNEETDAEVREGEREEEVPVDQGEHVGLEKHQ